MSFLKQPSPNNADACSCQSSHTDAKFNLRVEPIANDVREHTGHDEVKQVVNAERLQQSFLPTMLNTNAHAFGEGYHVHPEQPNSVAHLSQLHNLLDAHGLTARVSLSRGGDHSTLAATLDRAHVDKLMENGVADIQVPMNQGTFRLHSTRPGRITAVEFCE